MVTDFDIIEHRPDGGQIRYTFQPSNKNEILDSYDGDSLIYYNLDNGTYISEEPYGSKLERISKNEYRITSTDGSIYSFNSYYASWRANEDPKAGKITSVQERNQNKVTLEYDSVGQIKNIADSVGRQVHFSYEDSLITSVKDVLGRTTNYHYNEQKELTKVVLPDERELSFTYNNQHQLTQMITPDNGTEVFEYENNKVSSYTKNGVRIYRYAYNQNEVIRTDDFGASTTYKINSANRISKKTDAYGHETQYNYSSTGRLLSSYGQEGNNSYEYDEKGRVIKKRTRDGMTTNTTYNQWNDPLEVTIESGGIYSSEKKWIYHYDERGNLIESQDPMGHIENWTYKANGLVSTHTDPRGNSIIYEYNSYGQVTSITDPMVFHLTINMI